MPHSINFYIGAFIFIATAVTHGTLSLTNIVPDKWAPWVKAYATWISIIGTAYLTGAIGLSN